MLKKLTNKEIDELSTQEERSACARYKDIQQRARDNGGLIGETDLLIASEAISVLVARNKRLGLIK